MKIGKAFNPGSRYRYDETLLPEGFKQWDTDQDAWYFGVWVNPDTMTIITYAEGDETTVVCESKEEFAAELKRMAEFYGDPPPFAVGISPEGVTHYFDERVMEAS